MSSDALIYKFEALPKDRTAVHEYLKSKKYPWALRPDVEGFVIANIVTDEILGVGWFSPSRDFTFCCITDQGVAKDAVYDLLPLLHLRWQQSQAKTMGIAEITRPSLN